jgi:hypothetical protein
MLNKGKEPLEIRGITAKTKEKSKHYPGEVTMLKAGEQLQAALKKQRTQVN